MEKNTILAFVLCLLVLIIWFVISPKQQDKVPVVEEPQRKQETAKTESTERAIPQPLITPEVERRETKKEILPTKKETEKEIFVETPLYKAVFSNVGPTIKSFKLKNYQMTSDPDSPLVDMIDTEKNLKPFLQLDFDQGPNTVNKGDVYHITDTSLNLDLESPPRDLVFSATTPNGVIVNQTFRIYPDRYPVDITVNLSNRSTNAIEGNLKATLRNYPPKDKKSYYSFIGLALLLNDELETIALKKIEEDQIFSGRIGWIAYENDYFMSAIIPDEQKRASFQGRYLPSGLLEAVYVSPLRVIPAQQGLSVPFTIYLGPRDLSFLKPLQKKLELAINFGWTDIIAKPLLYALRFFHKYVKNYGVAIILLTILIKILFWPLTHKSYKSMKEMQKLQPLMAKIREKYKNNKEQMNKELMGLYKTYKVNPMGGCLPMLIQMPVFFALFRILGSSTELRHAPFFLWINDLSAPDRLFHFSFQIPFMSPPYGIPILTLLMGASMFLQQKMTPTPGDPSQAKIMMFLPIIFTFMFINFPSGLVLYWLTNNILSIGQQYRIKRG
jgi:YidC/Oxa1 family membrane protein insertase